MGKIYVGSKKSKNLFDFDNRVYFTNSSVGTSNMGTNSVTIKGKGAWGNSGVEFETFKKNTSFNISANFTETAIPHYGRITVYGTNAIGSSSLSSALLDTGNISLTLNTPTNISGTFNSGSYDYIFIRLWCNPTSTTLSDDATLNVDEIQLELGSTATAYEPYQEPNKAKEVSKVYIGVSDVAKEVAKVYVGVNNKARLVFPDLYEIVNNIESTGTQYINTGIKVAKDIKMELDLKFNTLTADTQANGGYFQEGGTSYKNYILLYTSDSVDWSYQLGVWNRLKIVENADTNRHTFSIDCVNSECSVDQNVYALSSISGDYTATNDILLFARSMSNGSVIANAIQTLYSAKIWKNNVLVRNFVPAKRKADNVLGLLDTITYTFYENQGTGTFSIEQ